MARPRFVSFRVTDAELSMLKADAAARGLSVSDMIRHMVIPLIENPSLEIGQLPTKRAFDLLEELRIALSLTTAVPPPTDQS